ncbi:MAG: SpoIID/LytB domain-containing protein [candidate division Zixibacteria bacterium]|nr:SpoIID/LytB domain-containing protein [candidate division Zixibacteria bacterium]MDH3936520.1 SpoIID/LytB domain-containing protein [candidate division Zixibacteria bacterium]MDH4034105.1 SpoIID/LytB domain-containing protein [candidate division Zixibacteria bacterium]
MTARIGTAFLVLALAFSCATVPLLKDETPSSFMRIPFVRVLLDESQTQVTVGGDRQFAIECLKDGEQEVYYSNRPVTIINRGQFLAVENTQQAVITENIDEVNVIPRGATNRLQVGGKRYRGLMKLLPDGYVVQLINVVYMEDYLRGVVPPEIGKRADSEIEAVKAQAVAARTYAMAHLQQYPSEQYDMKSSIMDQVYQGLSVENDLINRSIDGTAGQTITFDDKFINAYYHSTCGGMTDDIESVWDRKETPYLKAVADSGACSWSKYYTWREVFTESQLRGRLEQYLSSDRGRDMVISRITDVVPAERSPGGRIAMMTVVTEAGNYSFKKDRIRWVVGRTSNPDLILPSDRFDVVIKRDASGRVETVTFKGRGYGHGVGMCQCGAIGLARQGWSFNAILQHYFTGVELQTKY